MSGDAFISTIDSPAPEAGLSRLRLLCIAAREPAWTNLTLQLDAAGCHEPGFRWVATAAEALAALRNESYNCVLIAVDAEPPGLLIEAIRAGGHSEPIVLLTTHSDDRLVIEACRTDCEVLAAARPWESRALLPVIRRAIARAELQRANHRLSIAHRRRLIHERDEAERLLRQQREIIEELNSLMRSDSTVGEAEEGAPESPAEGTADASAEGHSRLPGEFHAFYQELLRTYVIMGSGSLGAEIGRVAEVLALAEFAPREALELHVARVEALVRGLGNRSTRHVMARADLLALELVIHLGECYQQQARAARRSFDAEESAAPLESFGGLAEAAGRVRRRGGTAGRGAETG